ncbi:hypothetical protein [Melissospora conviva]|uniref:hypothetical protein n=1 Tax=Melissospora conviva TaxID=3388432 RepID=UPI003C206953
MADPLTALTKHYDDLADRWKLCDRSGDYGPLVVPTGNAQAPFHRWFRMKEAYSHLLLPQLLKDSNMGQQNLSVLDPFSGGGTTAVSAISLSRENSSPSRVLAIERNPVMRLISHAKCAGISRGPELADLVEKGAADVVAECRKLQGGPPSAFTPSVTLNNSAYYSAESRDCLLSLALMASEHVDDADALAVIRVCIASVVEPAGRLRRDGRALRFAPERQPVEPLNAFLEAVNRCVEDMRSTPPVDTPSEYSLVDGDAREVDRTAKNGMFNWIVFSPPYPNNIDYTEIYKTEAWVLGMYDSAASMKRQRLRTLRSHTSLYFPDEYSYLSSTSSTEVADLVAPVLSAVPLDRYARGRRQLIKGYVDDMYRVLAACRSVCTADAKLALVVGNSVHGVGEQRFVIAADILIAALGELTGWDVEEIRVARSLKRRLANSSYTRESVVVLRPSAR